MYGTLCSLSGSYTAIRFIMSGSRFFRFGSWDLSSFWNTPALIWRCRNGAEGTTTS